MAQKALRPHALQKSRAVTLNLEVLIFRAQLAGMTLGPNISVDTPGFVFVV